MIFSAKLFHKKRTPKRNGKTSLATMESPPIHQGTKDFPHQRQSIHLHWMYGGLYRNCKSKGDSVSLRMKAAMPYEESVHTLMGSVARNHKTFYKASPNTTIAKKLFPN